MGAAVSRAGAHRTTPLATATLVVAANAPDVDVSAFLGGEYAALAVRRGITHGVPALVVLPFLVVAVMLAWDRFLRRRADPTAEPARAGPLLAWAAVGLATHPVLDWMNTYGMRWWLPFDGTWTYGDALFIVDPWIWLALGGSVFLSVAPRGWGRAGWGVLAVLTTALFLSRPVDAGPAPRVLWMVGLLAVLAARATGRPRTAAGRERLVRGALAATVAYVAAMVAADGQARQQVRMAAEARGLTVVDVMVGPLPVDPFSAELEVRTPTAFVHGGFHWFRSPRVTLDLEGAVPLSSAPPGLEPDSLDAIVTAARDMRVVRNYLTWSRFPYVTVTPAGADWRVRFSDARCDNRPEAGGLGGVVVTVPGGGRAAP